MMIVGNVLLIGNVLLMNQKTDVQQINVERRVVTEMFALRVVISIMGLFLWSLILQSCVKVSINYIHVFAYGRH